MAGVHRRPSNLAEPDEWRKRGSPSTAAVLSPSIPTHLCGPMMAQSKPSPAL